MCRRLLSLGLLLVCATVMLSGCWSRIELNDIGIVLGLGVDVGEREALRLTLYVPRPLPPHLASGGGGNQEPVWVVAREADNFADALALIRLSSARRLVFQHLRVVLIGEEYARRHGIGEILDVLATDHELRLTVRPFLVEGQAQEVFETLPQLRSFQPFNLTAILQAKGGLEWRLKDVLAARMSDTHSVWMPTLKVIPRQAKTSLGPSTTVTLSGVALFRRDYLQVVLDPWAYQVMVWFLGNPTGFTITAHCPNGEYGTLSARVVTGKLRVRPYWQGDRPAFRVEATSRVNVTRSACRTGAVEDADVRDQLEQALSDDLRQRIEHFIEIMQTRVADPVGFGKHAQLAFPQFYKKMEDKWGEEVWIDTPVEVVARVTITQVGLVTGPVHPTERELREGKQ